MSAVVLLSGSSGTLAQAITQTIAAAPDCHVVAAGRRSGLDVRDPRSVEVFADAALERFGRIDAAIACAGVSWPGALVTLDAAAIADTLAVNLHGARHLALAALRRGATRIVFVGSLYGVGAPAHAVYAASKGALVGLMRGLTPRYPHAAISVLVPGFVETAMTASLSADAAERLLHASFGGAPVPAQAVADAAMMLVRSPLRGVVRVAAGLVEAP